MDLDRFLAKVKRHAAQAIGCELTIVERERTRTGGKMRYTGTIVECSYAGSRGPHGMACFRVTLECGPAKIRRTAVVTRLPRW